MYISFFKNDNSVCVGYSSQKQQGSSWAPASEETRCPKMHLRWKFADHKKSKHLNINPTSLDLLSQGDTGGHNFNAN